MSFIVGSVVVVVDIFCSFHYILYFEIYFNVHFCDLFLVYWIPNAVFECDERLVWVYIKCLFSGVSEMTAIYNPHIKIDLKFCYKLDWTRDFSISRCENVDEKKRNRVNNIMWCEGELSMKKKLTRRKNDFKLLKIEYMIEAWEKPTHEWCIHLL